MKLTKTTIENYKSCRNTTLECGANLTALIGLNAAGKTNILSAIYCLSHIVDMTGKEYADVKLTAQIALDDNYEGTGDIASCEEIARPISKAKEKIICTNAGGIYGIEEIDDFLDSIRYYSAAAFTNAPELTDAVDLGASPNALQPRNRFLYDLVDAKQSNSDLFERYTNLIGPEEMRLVDGITLKNLTDAYVSPIALINGKELLFKQLSEGTFRTMALLFYLISNDGGLVLIEEPENSVHHTLLRDVVEIMQNESEHKQIIFSTHSDLVLSMLKPENVVFVDNGPDGTKTRALSTELAKGNYKGLKSYLENEGNLGDYWKAGGFDD